MVGMRFPFSPLWLVFGLLAGISTIAYAQYPGQTENLMKVKTCVPFKAKAFDYEDVKLLDGPFKRAMEIDQRWLKEADVDRLLHSFRVMAGIKTHAQPLGGWESLDCELRGHSLGHFLSALALMYASTHEELYRLKGEQLVKGLAECQQVIGRDGYLSAFPEYFIDRAIQGGDVVWAPWYTLHKLYTGLLDQYTICGNKQAYEILKGMCNWAYKKIKPLTGQELQRMLLAEFGGMPEVFYNIYAITGDSRHKELAEMFYHAKILEPLAEHKDSLAGIHANTQIPKILGEARSYELTGNSKSRDIASFFWNIVVHDHSYVTGGNSDKEVFCEPRKLSENLSENTTETCNTYNMLKLTRHLFIWDTLPIYADYYERALYNHILSSQDPVSGGVTYYHTLCPGGFKKYHYPFRDNTCCVGTGYENHAKYGEGIYYLATGQKGIFVNLFIPSVLNWKEEGVVIRQETDFPDKAAIKLVIDSASVDGVRMSMMLRYPLWALDGVVVKVNGKKMKVKKNPGSYITVERVWKQGDEITMEMPMSLRVEWMPDNADKGALFYGPILLAADLGKVSEANAIQIPDLSGDRKNLKNWIVPVEGTPLTFRVLSGQGYKSVFLGPLFRMNDNRYNVYFDFK